MFGMVMLVSPRHSHDLVYKRNAPVDDVSKHLAQVAEDPSREACASEAKKPATPTP